MAVHHVQSQGGLWCHSGIFQQQQSRRISATQIRMAIEKSDKIEAFLRVRIRAHELRHINQSLQGKLKEEIKRLVAQIRDEVLAGYGKVFWRTGSEANSLIVTEFGSMCGFVKKRWRTCQKLHSITQLKLRKSQALRFSVWGLSKLLHFASQKTSCSRVKEWKVNEPDSLFT